MAFKLFLNFLKKNFAIKKTFVVLHPTNKQKRYETTNKQTDKRARLFVYTNKQKREQRKNSFDR